MSERFPFPFLRALGGRAGMLSALLFPAATILAGTDASLDRWPQWRGPLGNGVAPSGDPPVTWSETEHVRWKSAIPGYGTSTPIIWDDSVFILSALASGKSTNTSVPLEVTPGLAAPVQGGGARPAPEAPAGAYRFLVLAYDRSTGRALWQRTATEEVPHEGHHKDHGYASASPVADGQHLYAYFGSRGLYCYDFAGNLKWQKRFGKMQTRNSFGEGTSPTLHRGTLVILWDHEGEDFLVALDTQTGRELWRQSRDEPTGWTTPFVVERGGRTEVMVSATGSIRSYDLATGRPLWECRGMTANPIPTPVAGADLVYFTSGFRGSALLAIRLGRSGDLTGTEAIAWRHDRNTPYAPSPLLYDGRLYFFSVNNAQLSCLDALTGRPDYEAERLPEISGMYASPVGAAGRVYVAGRDGKCAVLKHGPKPEVLALNTLADRFDASPAVAGRELFLRGHANLYCLAAPPGDGGKP